MRLYQVLACAVLLAAPATAQDFKRQMLHRVDVPTGALHETVIGTAEIAPQTSTGRHTHPGVEMGVITSGEVEALVEGEPPRRLKAGESFLIPAGKAHDVRTVGDVPATVVVTWVVEKGKPLSAPAK